MSILTDSILAKLIDALTQAIWERPELAPLREPIEAALQAGEFKKLTKDSFDDFYKLYADQIPDFFDEDFITQGIIQEQLSRYIVEGRTTDIVEILRRYRDYVGTDTASAENALQAYLVQVRETFATHPKYGAILAARDLATMIQALGELGVKIDVLDEKVDDVGADVKQILKNQKGVKLQNPRDFAVHIRTNDPDDKQVYGTGIALDLDGHIVTCAHVVEAVLAKPACEAKNDKLTIYFPQLRGNAEKRHSATVLECMADHQDDIVLLKLDSPMPLAPEQMPVLGTSAESQFQDFRGYGFAQLGNRTSHYVKGEILGYVDVDEDELSLMQLPLELDSDHIYPGMSGAPVLELERNLVVGLITTRWTEDGIGWAVDTELVETLKAYGAIEATQVQSTELPKGAGAVANSPHRDQLRQIAEQYRDAGIVLHGAPPPLAEWVGRQDLLKHITADYADPDQHLTGLIGFGGEGKSSLARKWLDELQADKNQSQPAGIFWWSFYDKTSTDEFLEAALNFLIGGKLEAGSLNSASAKVQAIGEILRVNRYVFVLDGFEVMQHNEGDQYGEIKSNDLKQLLELFGGAEHTSFCLVTSRAPLHDFINYTSYTQRDVTRLSLADAQDLLKNVGVTGDAAKIEALIQAWDGHALTMNLLGTYLVEKYQGQIDKVSADELQPDTTDRYSRVHRVLRRYDEQLSTEQRAFLTLFSAFRLPVKTDSFAKVFRTATHDSALNAPLKQMNDAEFESMVQSLVNYRLLKYDTKQDQYTTHPLIRNHYLTLLSKGVSETHAAIKEYYLGVAGDTPQFPTLEDLQPLIEVVHHACRAGAYDEAFDIFDERISQKNRHLVMHILGAYETQLAIMQMFFLNEDTFAEPQVSKPSNKSWILNEVGFCLMNLGRLAETIPFYKHRIEISKTIDDWQEVSIGYNNLTDIYTSFGQLVQAEQSVAQSLTYSQQSGKKVDKRTSNVWQAWIAYLQGKTADVGSLFQQAEALEQEIYSNQGFKHLFSIRGIQHAIQLRRNDEADYARRVTNANLAICEHQQWQDQTSQCYRVLGELDSDTGKHASAQAHFATALTLARGIQALDVLIEILWARGLWLAKYHTDLQALGLADLDEAFNLLNEALDYCVNSGYKLFEADVRVALAWGHSTRENIGAARQEAQSARRIGEETGYHWAVVDADEVLGRLAGSI